MANELKTTSSLENIGALAGRFLLVFIFLASSGNKITNFGQVQGYMASHGMPATGILLAGAIVFLGVGGLRVVLGFNARIGALLLIAFIVPASLIFHNFWAYEGQEQQGQMIHFMKNLAILGALISIAATNVRGWRLDQKLLRSKQA